MNCKSFMMVGFSVACLGVAGLVHQERQNDELAEADLELGCMQDGIDTEFGRVGCFTPVLLPMTKALFENERLLNDAD